MIHVPSLFPTLLDFQLFAPLILRIAAGVFVFLIAFDSVRKSKKVQVSENKESNTTTNNLELVKRSFLKTLFGYIALLTSLCIILGLYTQGAALIVICLLILNSLIRGSLLNTSNTSGDALLLIIIICIALLLFGAGMPAIDLPL